MSAKATAGQILKVRSKYEGWLKRVTGKAYKLQLPMTIHGRTLMVKFVRRKSPGGLVQPAVFLEIEYVKALYNVRYGTMDDMADVTADYRVTGIGVGNMLNPGRMLDRIGMGESRVDGFISALQEKVTVEPTLTSVDAIESILDSGAADEDKFSWMVRQFAQQFSYLDGPDVGRSRPSEALLQKWWRLIGKPYGWLIDGKVVSWRYQHNPRIEIKASGSDDITVAWGGFLHVLDLQHVDSYSMRVGDRVQVSQGWNPREATSGSD